MDNSTEGLVVSSLATTSIEVHKASLYANQYYRLPISAGQQIKIEAALPFSGSKGWSVDNWKTHSGPDGVDNYYVDGSFVKAQIGALVGAFSDYDSPANMQQNDARKIFSANTFVAGSLYQSISPVSGWVYLRCNDIWSLADNVGYLEISVTLF